MGVSCLGGGMWQSRFPGLLRGNRDSEDGIESFGAKRPVANSWSYHMATFVEDKVLLAEIIHGQALSCE